MFWICADNGVDNTGMFLLLLSSAHRESRPFLLLTPPCQWIGWGYTRSWDGTQLGQLTQTGQRNIPYHMTSCSGVTSWSKEEQEGKITGMSFVFPSNQYTW